MTVERVRVRGRDAIGCCCLLLCCWLLIFTRLQAGVVVDTFNLRVFSLWGHSSFRLFFRKFPKLTETNSKPKFPRARRILRHHASTAEVRSRYHGTEASDT